MNLIDQIERLARLREQGLLSEDEFNKAKALIVPQSSSESVEIEACLESTDKTLDTIEAQGDQSPSRQGNSEETPRDIIPDDSQIVSGSNPISENDSSFVPDPSSINNSELSQLEKKEDSNEIFDKYGRKIKRVKVGPYGQPVADDESWRWGAIAALVVVALIVIVAGLIERNNYLIEASSSDSTKKKVPKWMYDQAIDKAEQAILVREHNDAIRSLQSIKNKYNDFSNVDLGKINRLIDNSTKQIKFIDQPGEMKYYETKYYGYQWFDKSSRDSAKLFFAYSRKCKRPWVSIGHRATRGGPVLATTDIYPSSYTSTLTIKFKLQGTEYLSAPRAECS